MVCLHRDQVIDIILSNAKHPILADALYDKVVKDIAGRYFFSEDYTLDDLIATEIADGKLKYDKDTGIIRSVK